jgi:IrrE N-terminal-like domain
VTAAFPSLSSARMWLLPEHTRTAVRYFADRLEDQQPGSLAKLRLNAEDEIAGWPDLAVRLVPDNDPGILASGCSTAGLYLQGTTPPSLVVAQSPSRGRNAFTILHELGHHLQRKDEVWLTDVLSCLSREQARRLEHQLCDAFASELLLPSCDVERYVAEGPATAGTLAATHRGNQASRAAVIVRMVRHLPAHSVAMLTDTGGEVLFSQANGDLFPQPRGSQLDQAVVQRAVKANGQQIHCSLALKYRTGTQLRGLSTTACIDHTGAYLFVVATPDEHYGQRVDWTSAIVECACGHQYTPFEAEQTCDHCKTPLCPECQHCACRDRKLPLCPRCFTELSVAEASKGLIEHLDCT